MRHVLLVAMLCSCTTAPASEGPAPAPRQGPVYPERAAWPRDQELPISDNGQGVTHDGAHWYFTSNTGRAGGRLARAKRDADLSDEGAYEVVDRPFPGWTHPGDLDHHDGWLYVALSVQHGGRPHNAIGAIPVKSALDPSTYRALELRTGPQSVGERLPWIARDPGTGSFYSSRFYTSRLERYEATYDAEGAPVGFRWCGAIEIDAPLWRVQGGTFSPDGRLWLATDPRHARGVREGALLVIEMAGHLEGPIDCDRPPVLPPRSISERWFVPKTPGSIYAGGGEIEGVTWWDLGEGRAAGQIHVMVVDQDLWGDDVTFEHVRVSRK